MALIFKEHNARTNSNSFILNNFEQFYIRLYAHGYTRQEIIDFLELPKSKAYSIRASLKSKFKTSNFDKITSKAFKKGLIERIDFLDETVKTQALKFTKSICDKYIKTTTPLQKIKEVKVDILGFYYACEHSIHSQLENKAIKDQLSQNEKEYIRDMYKGFRRNKVETENNLYKEHIKVLNQAVFEKLGVTNWFNVYKKALQLDIIKPQNISNESIVLEVNNTATNIVRLFSLKRLNYNEKKLGIYDELLKLYSNIEFAILLYDNAQ
ncbi:hypothetical protein GCM10023314_05550 [Algibacter agarivorans]|uniref:Uncharacterized protein n=1 Tax=Algibacter agarivorans TaxID=1109741 RepID=A0ABP9GB25_9FLAO